MKRIVSILLVALFCTAPLFAAEVKIGYIDLQRALNNSESGKAAKEKIAARVKEYEDQIEQKQKDLKKLKDDYTKQSVMLSEETRAAKKRDIQTKETDLERFATDIQKELQQKDNDFTKQIITDISKIINEMGSKEGYTMIFERTESGTLYADPAADLTDKVIKAYDASRKK